MSQPTCYLKFYGDSKTQLNKLFTFKCDSENDARHGVKRFEIQGLKIRAAWFTVYRGNECCLSVRLK